MSANVTRSISILIFTCIVDDLYFQVINVIFHFIKILQSSDNHRYDQGPSNKGN